MIATLPHVSQLERTQRRGWERILVPYDGSPLSAAALVPAAELARRSGASVTVAHAVQPAYVPDVSPALAASVGETNGRALLAEGVGRLKSEGLRAAELLVHPRPDEPPDAAQAILTALRASQADLVVMSTHGRTGAARAVLGSVAERVIRGAEVPLLLFGRGAIPGAQTWPDTGGSALPASVLVALSGDARSEGVLTPAVLLAEALGAGLKLLRVVPENHLLLGPSYGAPAATRGTRAYLSGQAEALLKRHPLLPFVRTTALVADPDRVASTIAEHARWSGARAIAMATHGRSGLARFLLGSVTTGVVAESSAPVLVVPPSVSEAA